MKRSAVFQPTPQQEMLLRAEVSDLLVSAAAGSGKTQVMTDRIVQRIVKGELDVREVLVMTFTEAAAANMRDKIAEKLRKAAEEAPHEERRRLRRQAGLLPHASVSTIHGFCLEILRSSSYDAVGPDGKPLVEPGFRVADAAEAEMLRLEALDRILTARYVAAEAGSAVEEETVASADFLRLVDAYGNHRGDEPVRSLALSIHAFLRSMPAYRDWAERELMRLRDAVSDFGSSNYARMLLLQLKVLLDRAAECIPDLLDALDGSWTFTSDTSRDQEWKSSFRTGLRELMRMRASLGGDGGLPDDPGGELWDAVYAGSQRIALKEVPRRSAKSEPECTQFMEDFLDRVAEPLHCLTGAFSTDKYRNRFTGATRHLFHAPASTIGEETAPTLPLCEALFRLVLDLDDEYARLKRGAGAIDFSDFEHLALAVLDREGPAGAFRTRFKEIYVDEYQDTSGIQEAIVERISSGNLFLVGDVKQSIYRFRHARPEIFQDKAGRFARGVPDGEETSVRPNGVLRELNRNFRSLPAILSATNLVFQRIMSKDAGEVDYDGTQELVPHRVAPERGADPVELVLIDVRTPQGDGPEDEGEDAADPAVAEAEEDAATDEKVETDRQTLEALWVAEKIRELAAVARSEGREALYSGIAVLSRTRNVAATVGEVLTRQGIPVEEDPSGDFLSSPELRTMEALVHLLDNPRQDLHAAAVMGSLLAPEPFSEEEMLIIRISERDSGRHPVFFHEAVEGFAESGEPQELREKTARFLAWVADLRGRALFMGLDGLIGHIYLSTGYLDRVGCLPGGTARIADLRTFHEWARGFESTRMRGLYGFARYIERMRAQGGGEDVRGARPGGKDAVRVATLHRSKGLEYPVVFLVGLGRGFNLRENKDRVLVSETLGIGPDVVDPERRVAFPSHLKLAVWEQSKRAMLAEEMRLLYVAMTRAMDRLYLVGSTKSKADGPEARLARIATEAIAGGGTAIPPHRVLAAKSMLEWLLMAFASDRPADVAALIGLPTEGIPSADTEKPPPSQVWRCTRVLASAIREGISTAADASTGGAEEPGPIQSADAALSGPYRFDGAAKAPSKVSVSELKRRTAPEPEEPDDGAAGGSLLPDGESGRREGDADEENRRLRVRFGALKSVDLEMKDLQVFSAREESPASKALLPNETGTAVHSVLRYLDLGKAVADGTEAGILGQIGRMEDLRMLTPEEATAARGFAGPILAFATSGLARRILAAGERVFREIPFTLSVPCTELYGGWPEAGSFAPEDRVMVQGIVDLWFVEGDAAVLVDYKTDRIGGDGEEVAAVLRKRYASQMDYYAKSIRAATGMPVAERVLWLVRQGGAYRV